MEVVQPSINRALRLLGACISRARRARNMSTEDFSTRMGVSRSTLARLEKGEPGVSIKCLASALNALGELDRLSDLIDPSNDDVGLLLTGRKLPKRIRKAHCTNEGATQHGEHIGVNPEGIGF